MTRRHSSCSFCENLNLPSICAPCVNYRLNDYNTGLTGLRDRREALYSRLSDLLVAKENEDDQHDWRVIQSEKLSRLKAKLRHNKEQLAQGKTQVARISNELRAKYGMLESALLLSKKNREHYLEKYYPNLISIQTLGLREITSELLHKQSMVIKEICRLFPQRQVNIKGESHDGYSGQYDLICNARLPRGLDPHSVPSEELGASLGYMVQLLNLVVQIVSPPALHTSGFAGSCSRIWQRDSYWEARPSSQGSEYPLFIPRHNSCSSSVENSWSDSSGSFDYSSATPHSLKTHQDLQRGISLLKKSVACITAYCYHSMCLELPSEATTFEAFAKLLAMLSCSEEARSVKMVCSRSSRQVQQLNQSVWNVNSTINSSTLLESVHALPFMNTTAGINNTLNSLSTILFFGDSGKNESVNEEWDIIEHPRFPPHSQNKDDEQWMLV